MLIGGFSCVNTSLFFGTSILFPQVPNGKSRKDLKLIYKIRNKDTQEYEEYEAPSLREFNLLLEGISDEDKIEHLFIVDIIFDKNRATEKHYLFNETYMSIFDKKKVLTPSEMFVFQLLYVMMLNDKGILNSYKTTAKSHSTMEKKTLFLCMKNTFISLSKDAAGLPKKFIPTTLLNRVNSKKIS